MSVRAGKMRRKLNALRTTLLLNGPMTLYELQKALPYLTDGRPKLRRPPQSTIDTHLKILTRKTKELIVYKTEPHKSGRPKKYYGFTLYGFLRAFRIPRAVAKSNFGQIMRMWLPQEKFRFILPKQEVVQSLDNKDVENSLANLCQMIANSFSEAEDFLDYWEGRGYRESQPSRIIQLAMSAAELKYGKLFIETSKTLCRFLPSYREGVRSFIQAQRSVLDLMEKELLGGFPQ